MSGMTDFVHEQSLKIGRTSLNLIACVRTVFKSESLYHTVDADDLFRSDLDQEEESVLHPGHDHDRTSGYGIYATRRVGIPLLFDNLGTRPPACHGHAGGTDNALV